MSDGYEFSEDWFSGNIEVWQEYLSKFSGRPGLQFLEIGCFEGRATTWLLMNILTHESSMICSIDTFAGSAEYRQRGIEADHIERRFDHNIRTTASGRKVRKLKGFSYEILRKLPLDHYDFVYVDGSHMAPDVLEDAVLSFRLLKDTGIMIFDDYEWRKFPHETQAPKLAIDAFLRVYAGQYELLLKAYQVVLRKKGLGRIVGP